MERQGETTVATKLRWGILGPGTIARTFAGGVAHSRLGTLVAIGARDPGRAGYAEAVPRRAGACDGYAALLADPEVEAVYIATPHPHHAEWAIKAAEAGKHALVEKPLGLTALRGRRDLPRRAPRRHLHGRGVHVPRCTRRPRSSSS